MSNPFDAFRVDYGGRELNLDNVEQDPLAQFSRWMGDALEAAIPEANAMTLATVDRRGFPRARMVLLKDVDARGFSFYTNYRSAKGEELAAAPHAALVFFWQALSRQVRVEGRVERLPESESDAYYASRSRDSKLGAWASVQSHEIAGRDELERRFEEAAARFPDEVPRPPHWGGFVLIPEHIEFWQGRHARMHDRLVYDRGATGEWVTRRLAP